MDWGVAFPNADLPFFEHFEATQELNDKQHIHQKSERLVTKNAIRNKQQVIQEFDQTCKFTEKVLVTKDGICSSSGSCHVDRDNYYGSNCQWFKAGTPCQVEKLQYTEVLGECSTGGHCKGVQGQVRLHHETCSGKRRFSDANQNKMSKVKQFLRNNMKNDQQVFKNTIKNENSSTNYEIIEKIEPQSFSKSSECRGLYNPSAYKKLELICTDCYNLFKESEVYTYCMSGCFASPFFLTCVRSLMMEEDMVKELVKMVGK